MAQKLLVYLTCILWPFLSNAQGNDVVYPKTFLWEITGNGLNQPSYLYGTIHVICKQDVNLSAVLLNKLLLCKSIFFETTFQPKLDTNNRYALLPKDTSLSDLLGEQLYQKFKSLPFDTKTIDTSLLKQLKPFTASRLVDMAMLGCAGTSYEMELLKIAQKNGITVNGLATPKEHAAIIDKIPFHTQVLQLKFQLRMLEAKKKMMGHLQQLYKNKEIWQLYRNTAFIENTNYTSPIKEPLLDTRNISWLPIIIKSIQQQSCFFAVGCAHLPGDGGVITLLREQGYTVNPIFYY
jgi:uncharacterized protein YbaP (TraB family)